MTGQKETRLRGQTLEQFQQLANADADTEVLVLSNRSALLVDRRYLILWFSDEAATRGSSIQGGLA